LTRAFPAGKVGTIEQRFGVEFGDNGRPLRVQGVAIDITERKRAENYQRVLVAELDHRVKNVLATVSAVAGQTLETSSSMSHFVAALDGRIRSMATAHELLSTRQWQGMPMAALVRRELAAYASSGNTKIDGPEVMLSAEAGQAMAMVIHELVTNAAKYGALSAQQGTVTLAWSVVFTAKGRHLKLSWTERGGPPPPTKVTPGFGSTLLSMYGHAETALTENGLEYALMVPLCEILKGQCVTKT